MTSPRKLVTSHPLSLPWLSPSLLSSRLLLMLLLLSLARRSIASPLALRLLGLSPGPPSPLLCRMSLRAVLGQSFGVTLRIVIGTIFSSSRAITSISLSVALFPVLVPLLRLAVIRMYIPSTGPAAHSITLTGVSHAVPSLLVPSRLGRMSSGLTSADIPRSTSRSSSGVPSSLRRLPFSSVWLLCFGLFVLLMVMRPTSAFALTISSDPSWFNSKLYLYDSPTQMYTTYGFNCQVGNLQRFGYPGSDNYLISVAGVNPDFFNHPYLGYEVPLQTVFNREVSARRVFITFPVTYYTWTGTGEPYPHTFARGESSVVAYVHNSPQVLSQNSDGSYTLPDGTYDLEIVMKVERTWSEWAFLALPLPQLLFTDEDATRSDLQDQTDQLKDTSGSESFGDSVVNDVKSKISPKLGAVGDVIAVPASLFQGIQSAGSSSVYHFPGFSTHIPVADVDWSIPAGDIDIWGLMPALEVPVKAVCTSMAVIIWVQGLYHLYEREIGEDDGGVES